MRYCYDDHDDALTIRLLTDEKISQTLEIYEDRHVYLDSFGHVIAIDILNASLGVKVDDLIDALDPPRHRILTKECFPPNVQVPVGFPLTRRSRSRPPRSLDLRLSLLSLVGYEWGIRRRSSEGQEDVPGVLGGSVRADRPEGLPHSTAAGEKEGPRRLARAPGPQPSQRCTTPNLLTLWCGVATEWVSDKPRR
jgi:uncharacterized protein YuzE